MLLHKSQNVHTIMGFVIFSWCIGGKTSGLVSLSFIQEP